MTVTIDWLDDAARQFVTSRVPRPAEGEPRRCFYVDDQPDDAGRRFVPMLVTEGEPGYKPMLGAATEQGTWYWGPDMATANRICDLVNAEVFGLDHAAMLAIVGSSIGAQDDEDVQLPVHVTYSGGEDRPIAIEHDESGTVIELTVDQARAIADMLYDLA